MAVSLDCSKFFCSMFFCVDVNVLVNFVFVDVQVYFFSERNSLFFWSKTVFFRFTLSCSCLFVLVLFFVDFF